MTFEQFQATRTAVADLGKSLDIDEWNGLIGFKYAMGYAFPETPNGFCVASYDDEKYYTDIAAAEQALYDFAASEEGW